MPKKEENMCPCDCPIASQGEAEAGTENTKMMTPLRTAQAVKSVPFTVNFPFIGYDATTLSSPSYNEQRWRDTGLDIIADLKAVGDGSSAAADTAAFQQYAAELVASGRGFALRLPPPEYGYEINETIVFDGNDDSTWPLRNIYFDGLSGGNAGTRATRILYIGSDADGAFDFVGTWNVTWNRVNFLMDAPSINQMIRIRVDGSGTAVSAVHSDFSHVGFAATSSANRPVAAHLRSSNSLQLRLDKVTTSHANVGFIIGDHTNADGGIAGGLAAVEAHNCYFQHGDVELRRVSHASFLYCIFAEWYNSGSGPTRGTRILKSTLSNSELVTLAVERCNMFGLSNQETYSDTFLSLDDSYNSVRFIGNRMINYQYGIDLLNSNSVTDQGPVIVRGNYADFRDTDSEARLVNVRGGFTGTIHGIGENYLSAGMIADGGVECSDARTQTVLRAKLPADVELSADYTVTAVDTTLRAITGLSESSMRADGGLMEIDAAVTVTNGASTGAYVIAVFYNSSEITGTRNRLTIAANQTDTMIVHGNFKVGPGTATLEVRIYQSAGAAGTVKANNTTGNAASHLRAKRVNV